MSSTALVLGPSDEDRYGWPGGARDRIAAVCGSLARRVVRAGARTVGFLPAPGALRAGASAAPLVAAVASAVLPFVAENLSVAVVDAWPTWPWGRAIEPSDQVLYRMRPLLGQTRLVEVAPVPCGDAEAAAAALTAVLKTAPPGVVLTLVNLDGYAPAGNMPAPAVLLDGVVLLAGRRRTSGPTLAGLAHDLRGKRNLGTLLLD